MSKLGRKDLFSPTSKKPAPDDVRRAALPEDGNVEKVMVMLSARQIHALDKICLEIRQTIGIKFKRSMLIRSIIDGFLEAAPSYDTAQNPADAKRIISQTVYPHYGKLLAWNCGPRAATRIAPSTLREDFPIASFR